MSGGEGSTFELVWRNDELTDPPGRKPEGFGEEHRMRSTVTAWDPPHRLAFTWGEDTIGFALTPTDGGTTFVLTEELGRSIAARNAAGWEVCLDRLVEGVAGEDWQPRFDRYVKEFEPVLGPQEGPPTGAATT
jgi:uncharacterized protein YndB with AHSA1/START domain